ncbi:MAG: hypothetical protein OXM56_13300 [Gammaproteobacteria bacterium]|nr:hypothetical protein [Gammaproteobacteria bacterium]
MDAFTNRMHGRGGGTRFLVPVVLVVAVTTLMVVLVDQGDAVLELDDDLCRTAATPPAGATLLVDFQKPVRPASYATLLRDISLDLPAGTELRAFALTSDPRSPRQFLGRLCKPYDNADLSIDMAKDAERIQRDCDDLPAQMPPDLRDVAVRFCERRGALQGRIDGAGGATRASAPVASAELMEALDATLLEVAAQPGPQTLYLFSDMLQHADWYSHLDLDWNAWRYADFVPLRQARGPVPGAADLAGLRVPILYIPRRELTDPRRPRQAHQAFWRAYLAGADVEFREQPALPGYAAAPVMRTLRDAESAAREREALERQRHEAELELARIAREAEAIEAERREGARLAERRDAMQQELRRQEDVLKQELARLRAEVVELDTETAETAMPEPVDTVDEPEAVAPDTLVACDVRLEPEFSALLESERYPGNRRVNYGDATITVSYVVDPDGATVDEDIAVVSERSVANKPEYFSVLSEDTVGVVKDWTFTVEAPDAGQTCRPTQRRMATFTYRQKCVGRPMPACRTVQSGVSFLEAAG